MNVADQLMHAGKCILPTRRTGHTRAGAALVAGLLLTTGCTSLPLAGSEPSGETDAPAPREETARSVPGLALLNPQHAEREIARQKDALAHRNELAIAPADTGYYMDILEAEFRQALQHSPVEAFRRETDILLRIPGSLAFATGSEQLEAMARPVLARIAEVVSRYDATLVIVDSHTDPTGDPAVNLELSKWRAIAVSGYLVDHGVDVRRILAFGHGESRPPGDNGSNTGGESSRRIEIRLTPIIRERASESVG